MVKTPKYEYKIVQLPKLFSQNEAMLNKLSGEMWELVSIFNHPSPAEYLEVDDKLSPLYPSTADSPLFGVFKRQL
jgi:hypothetical protein